MVIDRVAFNLSYGNDEIKKMTDAIYNKPFITYDETIPMIFYHRRPDKILLNENFSQPLCFLIKCNLPDVTNTLFNFEHIQSLK